MDALWSCLSKEQRDYVEAVSLDFWSPYITGVEKYAPNADIVHDRFHIMKYMNEAVDKVRRSEHKQLSIRNNDTLKGTKYLWLKNRENFTEKNT